MTFDGTAPLFGAAMAMVLLGESLTTPCHGRYYDGDFSVYCTIARKVEDNIWTRVQENILPNVTQSGAPSRSPHSQSAMSGTPRNRLR